MGLLAEAAWALLPGAASSVIGATFFGVTEGRTFFLLGLLAGLVARWWRGCVEVDRRLRLFTGQVNARLLQAHPFRHVVTCYPSAWTILWPQYRVVLRHHLDPSCWVALQYAGGSPDPEDNGIWFGPSTVSYHVSPALRDAVTSEDVRNAYLRAVGDPAGGSNLYTLGAALHNMEELVDRAPARYVPDARQHDVRTRAAALKCQACHVFKVACVALPCGHASLCATCAHAWANEGKHRDCTTCHEPVQRYQRLFLPA